MPEPRMCKECRNLFNPRAISRRGLCATCAFARQMEAIAQIKARKGHIYMRYKTGRMIADDRKRRAREAREEKA